MLVLAVLACAAGLFFFLAELAELLIRGLLPPVGLA
jgi:hypothetical protein